MFTHDAPNAPYAKCKPRLYIPVTEYGATFVGDARLQPPANRLNDDHHAKSHALDSAPAYFLVFIRLVLLGIFLLGAVKTFEAEQSAVRRGFIGRLVVLGTAWFAAMPVLVLVAMICAEYVQEPVRESTVYNPH